MRHFLRRALAPAMLAGGMQTPTAPRALVAASRRAHEGSAPQRVALRSAGDLPPVAARAQAHEATAVGAVEAADPGVDDGPRRRSPRRPDRSGRHSRCGPPHAPARDGLDGEAQGHSPVNAWASPTPTTRRFYRIPSCSKGFRSEVAGAGTAAGDLQPLPRSRISRAAFARAAARGRGDSGGLRPPNPPVFTGARKRPGAAWTPEPDLVRSSPGPMAIRRGFHRNSAPFQSHQQSDRPR